MRKNTEGVSKKQFEKLLKSVSNIERKLDVLITLEKSAIPMPRIGKEEEKILKLCDKKHSIEDMARKTNKKKVTLRVTISHLKNKGLIQSIRLDDKVVYERIR